MFRIYQPVEVIFGEHEAMKLGDVLASRGYERAFLLCDAFLEKNGLAKQIADAGDGRIVGISGDIEPDPTVQNIDDNKALVENAKADVLIALGGGSTMDCTKNVGFKDADDLAARIDALKEEFGLRTTLTEIGGSEDDIPMLARESFDNRNMRASAAEPTLEEVKDLYRKLL